MLSLRRSRYVCGGFAGTRGFSQGRRQFFQPPPLCCVRSQAVQFRSMRVGTELLTEEIIVFFFLLIRIHDNEGAAEMLIDTLGPTIVNAKDRKNR